MISIDTLPDDALLVIFDHYTFEFRIRGLGGNQEHEKAWQLLVQVCRRWRSTVFESPRRLDLRLSCSGRTRARDRLDIWPTLLLLIQVNFYCSIRSMDNIIAVLERTDSVYYIDFFSVESSDMEIILVAMQQPFPELTYLRLWSIDETVQVVPDSFLGGSAPRLERLWLHFIPFPGLPKLLSSTTHLRSLYLGNIPHSGYFSPDAMVAALSTLTSLNSLTLEFQSPRSFPDPASRRPPPSRRFVLPSFTYFYFKGVSEYLEDLVACIDAPYLNILHIAFFNNIEFHTPQLMQFICRTPKSKALEKAYIFVTKRVAIVSFSSRMRRCGYLRVEIFCTGLDRQFLSLKQVCTSCLPPLSILEDLYFEGDSHLQSDSIQNSQWLELFRLFMAVKNLYLSENFASRIAPALQELVEARATDVLPTLQNIFLKGLESSGSAQESIGQFVAARQVANHPIGISPWIDPENSEDKV